jgi:hypothetical protein
MPGIFISYRREDSAGHAGRLFDRLGAKFGRDRVFMDVSAIEVGLDFVDTIKLAIGSCDILLAVIGREWATCKDQSGHRRLDDPNDFIRLEIATALSRNVRVIPVLVQGAPVPDAGTLPPDLKLLTRRQTAELRDTRWGADVDDLIVALESMLAVPPRVPAGVPPGRSAGQPATVLSETTLPLDLQAPGGSMRRWPLAGGAVLLLATAGLLPFGSGNLQNASSSPTATQIPVSADPAPGAVIRQTPAAGGEPRADSRSVAIDVAERPPPPPDTRVAVPRLVGKALDRASEHIRKAGFTVGTQRAESRQGAARSEVLRQNPAGGTRAARGTRIDVVYARPEGWELRATKGFARWFGRLRG